MNTANTTVATDTAILQRLRALETGAITDAIKQMGINGWMCGLHPVNPNFRMVGRAFTLQFGAVKESDAKGLSYYNLLDEIAPGDVLILASGGITLANMGENMQHAAKVVGAAGIVSDACNRDTAVIREIDMPVFSRGSAIKFVSGDHKIIAFNTPVMCGGILVNPGDYIIGDVDGVIALPQHNIQMVIVVAEEIMKVEKQMEEAIDSGISMAECQKVIAQKRDIYKKKQGGLL